MANFQIFKFIFACFIGVALSGSVFAINLGRANLVSKPGETLRVEVPIELGADEQYLLSSLTASIPPASTYERLGISAKILDFNTQVMIYRSKDERLMVLIETVQAVPVSEDAFVDLLLTLNWSTGSLSKVFTFLNGSPPKLIVEPGQTLSLIASQMDSGPSEFTIDQKMMALYQANPDAFAGGNINRLFAGSELFIPSASAIQAIESKDAQKFVNAAAQQLVEKKPNEASVEVTADKGGDALNRLKIGSSNDNDADTKRITEDIVAQEKILEQTNTRVIELEKNIADLKKLLGQVPEVTQVIESDTSIFNSKLAFATAFCVLLLTSLLIWFFMRNSNKQALTDVRARNSQTQVAQNKSLAPDYHQSPQVLRDSSHESMPNNAKELLGSIDLDLPSAKSPVAELTPDELRVRLNLARAYITIEDFSAANKSLEEIIRIGASIDPVIVAEAQGIAAEISRKHG
jgi:pilus assembly protein FimV